jgi:hypothetical protein
MRHTIGKVHGDIYQLVLSSILEWVTYQPSLLILSILSLHSSSRYYLVSHPFLQKHQVRKTYTQTPSLPSLFLTFNWKIPLVCPFSITPWEILCLNMGGTDLLDCIFLCLVVHLLEDFCEGLSLVWVGRTRLTAKTSLV